MIIVFILSKRFFQRRKELSDEREASIAKKKYRFTVCFSYRFIKSISQYLTNFQMKFVAALDFLEFS